MTIRRPLLAWLLASAAAASQAQTVWRCGADGRSYSDSPCPEGRPVAVADARSSAQVAQAQDVLVRDRRLAQQLVAARHEREREARARGSGLAAIRPTEAVRPAPEPRTLAQKPRRQSAKPRPAAVAETSRAADRGSRRRPG